MMPASHGSAAGESDGGAIGRFPLGPEATLGWSYGIVVVTLIAVHVTCFSVGHTVREICLRIKENDLYRGLGIDESKVCNDRLPTISYMGVLMPEQAIFSAGLSLAALIAMVAHAQLGALLLKQLQGSPSGDVITKSPPLLRRIPSVFGSGEQQLSEYASRTARIGQASFFCLILTACVSMKHQLLVHGFCAFLFFVSAVMHLFRMYTIQHSMIECRIVVDRRFDQSYRLKDICIRTSLVLLAAGVVGYAAFRFTSYQLYLYTLAGPIAEYVTVLWLMVGYSSYYMDILVLGRSYRQEGDGDHPYV